jgi:hypothetical protein
LSYKSMEIEAGKISSIAPICQAHIWIQLLCQLQQHGQQNHYCPFFNT